MTELTEHFNRDKAKAGFRGPGCALAPSACPVERALGWAGPGCWGPALSAGWRERARGQRLHGGKLFK